MEEQLKQVEEMVSGLMSELSVEADVKVEPVQDNDEGGFKILLDTPENALLIGKHGNTLASFETIFSLMLFKKFGEYKRVILEIGGWRQEREEYLKNLIERLKQEVLANGIEKTIRGLKSWERRVVHLFFKDDPDVKTESTGEGRDRVLVVKKK